MGLKVLERYAFLSTSEIKVGKEQSDHDDMSYEHSFFPIYKIYLPFAKPTPGRFYGLVKNQKGVPEGEKIPPSAQLCLAVGATQR